jgi:hypothetical protein
MSVYLIDFLELHVDFLEVMRIEWLSGLTCEEDARQDKYFLAEEEIIEC